MLIDLEDSKRVLKLPREITAENNMLHKSKNPVVILGRGEIEKALTVNAHKFTKSAKEKIEAAGGKAELIEDK